jgi:hypothetical protein
VPPVTSRACIMKPPFTPILGARAFGAKHWYWGKILGLVGVEWHD